MTVVMHQCSNFNSVTGALALCITNDDDDDDIAIAEKSMAFHAN